MLFRSNVMVGIIGDVITYTPLAQTWENRKNVNPSKLALVKTLSV